VSRFHVLRSQTRFRRYRGRPVPFSSFALPDSFPTVPRASDPVFMFCPPGLIFGCTEGVRSHFHVLRSRTHFRRYRGRRVPFSCFARQNSISTVPWASGPFFMFCAPGLVFSVTEGVRSRFQVLRARTRFRRYRGHRDSFSCFALQEYFSAVPRASGPVYMFCHPGYVFGGSVGVGSRFHALRSRTRFRRFRRRRVPFSCFARPDSFSAVTRASGLVLLFSARETRFARPDFMFCAPGLIFGGAVGVRSGLHAWRSRTRFRRYRGRQSHFHVSRSRTRIRRNRGHQVPFSCFALPDTNSA
jgi:hypothetical protein